MLFSLNRVQFASCFMALACLTRNFFFHSTTSLFRNEVALFAMVTVLSVSENPLKGRDPIALSSMFLMDFITFGFVVRYFSCGFSIKSTVFIRQSVFFYLIDLTLDSEYSSPPSCQHEA